MPSVRSIGSQSAAREGHSGGRAAAAFSPSAVSLIPRRSSHPMMQNRMLPINGSRQPPHGDEVRGEAPVHEPCRGRAQDEADGGAHGRGAAHETAQERRGLLGRVDHGAREFASQGEALYQAHHHEEERGGDADPVVGGQEPHEQGSAAHEADRQGEQRPAADPVAHHPEHDPAQGARQEADRENAEGHELLGDGARLRHELGADVAGEIAEHGEIEPFEHVPDQAGKNGAKRRLMPCRECPGVL